MRLFAACFPPHNVLEKIIAIQTKLRSYGHANASWVDQERLHITLRFYGNNANINSCARLIDEAIQGINIFRVKLTAIGAFPNLSKARTLFLQLENCPELQLLGERLGDPPSKNWHPHLTLARFREPAKISSFSFDPIEFQINEVLLIQSLLLKTHSQYERIRTWPLT
jgi:2'-5' RNA ligase